MELRKHKNGMVLLFLVCFCAVTMAVCCGRNTANIVYAEANNSYSIKYYDTYRNWRHFMYDIEKCLENGRDVSDKSYVVDNAGAHWDTGFENPGTYDLYGSGRILREIHFMNSKNAKNIFTNNNFSVNCWWIVTLPNYCKNETGKYTFDNYDKALDFAIKKEYSYRVKSVSDGWIYINIANETVSQIYKSKVELDQAIEFYAKKNISQRINRNNGNNELPNPESEDITLGKKDHYESVSYDLVRQIQCPEHLKNEYFGNLFMLIDPDYIFTYQSLTSAKVQNISATCISTGETIVSESKMTIADGESLKVVLERNNSYRQGYYLIEEQYISETLRFIVFIDTEQPKLVVNAFNGSNSKKLTISQEYLNIYGEVMQFSKLDLGDIADVDEYCVLSIEGRALSKKYISQDVMPILSYDNGYYGRYDISLYDRSGNTLDFSVMIAGAPPTVEHTSLTNDTKCTLTINLGDNNNALTSLKLYKVLYTGARTQITMDDDGTAVGVGNYQYVLRNGGKYVVEMMDIYGRSVTTEPIFYLKGLPSGTLKGVQENGVTNRDVSLTFSDDAAVILYVWNGSAWVEIGGLETMRGNGTVTATLPASKVTGDKRFKFFLYNASERNLFVEYEFRMKCVLPEVQIRTVSGSALAQNTVTRDSFKIDWTQNDLKVIYYRADSVLGEMNASTYRKGTFIEDSAVWRFHVTDSVGNTLDFDVTLDNEVKYTLDGNYELFDDEYVSKYWLTLTVAEDVRTFRVTSSNGLPVTNGQKLTQDGTYQYFIEDLNGNVEELTLIVDKTPPVPVIRTEAGAKLSPNARTNRPFTVACEEADVTISYAFDNGGTAVYTGETLIEPGTYSFRLRDRMGNSADFTVTIDEGVSYSIDGTYIETGENTFLSKNYLILNANEPLGRFEVTSDNGVSFVAGDRVTIEGVYTVTLEDTAGNTVVLTMIIDKTAPVPVIRTDNGAELALDTKTNRSFTVTCSEAGAVITYSTGGAYVEYAGQLLNDVGTYSFRIRDVAGNERSFTVTIDRTISYTLGGTYIETGSGRIVSKSWLSIEGGETLKHCEIVNADGVSYTVGERLTEEGTYTATLEDSAGNTLVLTLEIDKTAPVPVIRTETGDTVALNGRTQKKFRVSCAETDAVITYSTDGTFQPYSGELMAEPGTYSFRIRDVAGNESTFGVTIDRTIDYTVSGAYVENNGQIVSKNYLTIDPVEELARFNVQSGNGVSFAAGERVTVEGVYTVTLEDLAGNIVVLTLVIDKTPPVQTIRTENGAELEPGTKTNGAFIVTFDEEAVVFYSIDNDSAIAYAGSALREPGEYRFTALDIAGNLAEFIVTVDFTVAFSIGGTYLEMGENAFLSKNYLVLEPQEPIKRVETESANGIKVIAGQKVAEEGTYRVTIEDEAGNIAVLTFMIDKTAPVPVIRTEDGAELMENAVTNRAFSVVCAEEDVSIRYMMDNGAYTEYSGLLLSEEGEYGFELKDRIGNVRTFTVTVRKNISFVFSGNYIIEGENRYVSRTGIAIHATGTLSRFEVVSDNGVSFDAGETVTAEGTYTVTLEDDAGNVAVLTLVIDKTPPEPEIRTESGAALASGGNTRESFTVTCGEDGAALTYSMSGYDYTEYDGRLLTENGTYYFRLRDAVGNERACVVKIDRDVRFTVGGVYVEKDGRFIAKTYLTVDPGEALLRFEVVSDNGVTFVAGERVTEEGTYTVTLGDVAGNTVVLALEIDKTAPSATIRAEDGADVAPDSRTNKSFSVTCAEAGASIAYSTSGTYQPYGGEPLIEPGMYSFRLRDFVGNERYFDIVIDREVEYTLGGTYIETADGQIVSKLWLSIEGAETLARFELRSASGKTFAVGERLTEEGTYTVTLEDLACNNVILTLVIDKTPPVPVICTESGGTIEQNGKTQENYTVTCAEADAVITFSVDGTYQPYGGQTISEIGMYSFRIRDAVGNILNFDVTIDREIKFSVDGAAVVNEARYLSKNYLVIEAGEELPRFEVANANGVSFIVGEKVTVEGVYTVTLGDAAGNTAVLTLVIDKTAPEPVIRTEDGFDVASDSAVPKSFRVTCEEHDVTIKYSVDGTYQPYNGELLTEPGTYSFRLRDTVGNERHFDVTIDSGVKYTLGGTYIERDGRIFSKSWLSIEGGETLARFELRSAGGVSYAAGERLTEEGTYTATLGDVAGNVVVLTLEIDKTAPVPVIRTEEGVDVAPDSAVSKSFCVTCEEAGASVSVLIGGLYKPYGGELLIEPETYAFRLRDAVGNEREFYVTIDNTLKYTLEGTYIEPGNGRLVSKSGLTIVAGETFSRFEVVSDNGKTFVAGEEVTAEGTYTVTIGDAAGNVVVLTLEIDKTAPEPIIRTESDTEIEPDGATGDGFRVTCAEQDAVITYFVDGTYQPYNGGLIDEGGIYTFVMRDVVGNERNFTVTVDREVLYSVGGAYVLTDDGRYLSMSWLTVDEKETLARCEITDRNGKSFEAGKKLSEEGTYTAKLEDAAGNVVVLTLVVDKTPPKITLRGVGIGGVTGGDVTVTAEGFVQLLDSQGALLRELEGETVISDHGDYRVKATDDAGNTATIEFSVDKLVEASAENLLYSGQIMTGSVGFTFAEPVTLTATKDGQPFEYKRGSLKDPGSYIVSATDVVGNVRSWSFRLLPTIAKTYAIPLPEGWTAWVQRDGATVTGAVSGGQVVLTASGGYVVEFDDGKNVWQVVLTVKNTPPVVEIVHDGDYIVMKNPDDVKLTLEVMKDGKPYSYTIGETFTKNGSYVVIVTDEYGNTAQYTFEIQYLNVAGKIAIAIGCLAALALVLFLIISRLRTKVR